MNIVTIPVPYVERQSTAVCPHCDRRVCLLFRFYADEDYQTLLATQFACPVCSHSESRDAAGE